MTGNHWTVFNSAGAVVADNMPLEIVHSYMTPERFERGWNAVYCVVVRTEDDLAQVSTARGCNPEEDGTPGDGADPAAGNLRTAIEEALASLECGMVEGAACTLREALSRNIPA